MFGFEAGVLDGALHGDVGVLRVDPHEPEGLAVNGLFDFLLGQVWPAAHSALRVRKCICAWKHAREPGQRACTTQAETLSSCRIKNHQRVLAGTLLYAASLVRQAKSKSLALLNNSLVKLTEIKLKF